MFVVCFSGTVASVHDELLLWERPEMWTSSDQVESTAFEPALERAHARSSVKGPFFGSPAHDDHLASLSYKDEERGFVSEYIRGEQGEVVATSSSRVLASMARLHTNLLVRINSLDRWSVRAGVLDLPDYWAWPPWFAQLAVSPTMAETGTSACHDAASLEWPHHLTLRDLDRNDRRVFGAHTRDDFDGCPDRLRWRP